MAGRPVREDGAKPRRGRGRLVLLRDLLLAVPPAAVGDARGDPPVGARRVHRDRGAEARADHADAIRIDLGPHREEAERALRVLDLLETDDAAARPFALAAAAHVAPERRVAEDA